MVQKPCLDRRAQVSIEILILAGVIITLSVASFSFYTQIRGSTIAMELLKVEALKKIDEKPEQISIKEIGYKVDNAADKITLCLFLVPSNTTLWDVSEETTKQGFISERTGFGTVEILQNPDAYACD